MSATPYESAADAERAFYAAFTNADLDAMRAVWIDSDEMVCVHPMGPRLQGRDAIIQSWRDIFGAGARLHFRIERTHAFEAPDLSVRCVHEHITQGRAQTQRGLVIATNAYRKTEQGWRMVLHHGSPGAVEVSAAERRHVVH